MNLKLNVEPSSEKMAGSILDPMPGHSAGRVGARTWWGFPFNDSNVGVVNDYFAEMWSASEEGSYLKLIECVYHSTLGSGIIKKKKKVRTPRT